MDIFGPKKDYKESKKEDDKTVNALPRFEIKTMKDDLAESEGRIPKGSKKIVFLNEKTFNPLSAQEKPPISELAAKTGTEKFEPPDNLPVTRKKASLPGAEELFSEKEGLLLPPLPPEKPTPSQETILSKPLIPTPEDVLALPEVKEPEEIAPVYAPEKTKIRKKLKYILIGALIVILAGGGVFLYLSNKEPEEVSPPPQNNEPQISAPLINIESKKILSLNNNQNLFQLLRTEARSSQQIKTFERIGILKNEKEFLSLGEVFQNLEIPIPPYVLAELKNSYNLVIFNQETGKRTGIIVETNNAENLKKQLKIWEPTMLADCKNLYVVQAQGQPASKNFLDDNYRGVLIRYMNLPYPTLTINYTILGNLFIVGTSKELIYTTIDRILEK